MKEYIEREALFKKVLEERRFVFQMEDLLNHELVVRTVYNDFAEFVNSIPAADVVEVTRCKDCIHWKLIHEHIPHMECNIFCGAYDHGYPTNADDFCSYGERRSE